MDILRIHIYIYTLCATFLADFEAQTMNLISPPLAHVQYKGPHIRKK